MKAFPVPSGPDLCEQLSGRLCRGSYRSYVSALRDHVIFLSLLLMREHLSPNWAHCVKTPLSLQTRGGHAWQ